MATILQNLSLELAHFNNFKHHIPGYADWCSQTIHNVLVQGLMQVSTAFEVAIANVGGYTVISTDYADLSDGSDAKLSCVRTASNGKNYAAPITNTKNKTGLLRVQVYERKQNQFYYFVIPHAAYKDIPVKSNIEIPFELNGDPRRNNRCSINWWAYEVAKFETMAKSNRSRKKF